jgi:hypothetical protein
MGLLNTRNLLKAKDLLEKNRHKVGDVVEKAGGTLDKVSKGKTAAVTAKASDAAKKYSEGAAPTYGTEIGVDDETSRAMRSEDAQLRQAQATESAANAVKGVADALTNMLNQATARAEQRKRAERPEG